MTALFQLGDFTLNSGQSSSFKIECDALTDVDYQALAFLLSERLPHFGRVEGVPRGGLPLAAALEQFADPDSDLLVIVDDVWTTGGSMERHRAGRDAVGAVVFARNPVADWVLALFEMTPA